MPFHPIFAFMRNPQSFDYVAERLVSALHKRMTSVTYDAYEVPSCGRCREVRLRNEHDEVVLSFLPDDRTDDRIMVEFWVFDPSIDDAGGPTKAMAEYKHQTAIRVLQALLDQVGARFAYFTSPLYKHYEHQQHEFQQEFTTALRTLDKDGAIQPFQAAIRNYSLFWLLAVRKDEPLLRNCIAQTWPTWDRVGDTDISEVLENSAMQPRFMDPEFSRRWNDDLPTNSQ